MLLLWDRTHEVLVSYELLRACQLSSFHGSYNHAVTTLIELMIRTPPERNNLPRKDTVLGHVVQIKGQCNQKDVLRMTTVLSVLHHSSILKAAVNLLMVNCATAPNITFLGHVCKFLKRAETLFGRKLHAIAITLP